ncbi:Ribosomal large subunit pseudouridine synthase A [Neorhodopirellula pilleata]|uniref:Pseudouridine synthase n=2 Tax=Neorhodopirellula pilleata TaxID=2714738 RepID=A0A5C5ZX60_9BACT|nr:Ribosomal large subunit pseudouridine synthase A [Neorhodopirellula pilleata]
MDGLPLIEFLQRLHPPTPIQQWQSWIADGAITSDGVTLHPRARVRCGQRLIHTMPDTIEPEVARRIGIVHEDASILVVDKPAPMPVHPSGRFNLNTLTRLLESYYPNETLRIAHRLDANTTGIVLFCRTRRAAGLVQPQFESRKVRKEYVAQVHGMVPWDRHDCRLPIARATQVEPSSQVEMVQQADRSIRSVDTQGARVPHEQGQSAQTQFRVLDRANEHSRVQAIPITGRTNQIRVHLWSLGHPIVGDPLYLRDQRLGEQQTLAVDQPPMHLHARSLTIVHPDTNEPVTFRRPAAFETNL